MTNENWPTIIRAAGNHRARALTEFNSWDGRTRRRVLAAVRDGMPQKRAAEYAGVAEKTVNRWVKAENETIIDAIEEGN